MSATGDRTLHGPALDEVMGWLDARVRDATGRRLGRVNAVVADARGTPWWLVLRHRGCDVVAPVAAVHDTRHREIMLDCTAEVLAPCPEDLDERAHDALVARFGLGRKRPVPASRSPRGACAPRSSRRRLRSRRAI